jgi:predicted nuclease of predicted toxin-antitoxin system
MKILFDQGTPAPLREALAGHSVATVYEQGWAQLENGDLLTRAEAAFDAFVTTDQNLRYQQNLTGRKLAILVLPTTSWPKLRAQTAKVADAIAALRPGNYVELRI